MKRTAVVILNWNGRAMLEAFLPSVVAGSEGARVVVADNASTDDSLAFVRREYPNVEIIELAENYGFAEGYNRALAQVDAEFFVLLNSDVEVSAHWLEPLEAYLDAHPDVAAVQPKLLAHSEKDRFEYAGACGGFVDWLGYPFCRGRVMSTLEKDAGQYETAQDVLWASGAALMIRRSDWQNAGGLDGRFFAHCEEIDLCWRLRSRGRRVVCVPSSKVWHVGGGTLAAGHPRKTFLNFRNNLLMLYKNLPERELKRALRLRWWLDRVAALKFLLTDGAAHAKAVMEARREFRKRRAEFQPQREENLRLRTVEHIPEVLPTSLLRLYYLKGKKTYAALAPYFPKKS